MFTTSQIGAVAVIGGDESLTASNLNDVIPHLDKLRLAKQFKLIFNLEQVPLLDSAGLELLLDTADECGRHGGQLQLVNANALCQDILRITGVGDRFESFSDVRSAARSFSR